MQSFRSLMLAAACAFALTGAARADTRIFLLDNFEGYGVDDCLASGAPCGERVANAWCRAHEFARAIDYGRAVASDPVRPVAAGATPVETCTGPLCPVVVAITCTR